MSNKASGIIVILVVLFIVLSGGLSGYISVSVDTDSADGVPDNGVSWGQTETSRDYTCTGSRENMVCTEK